MTKRTGRYTFTFDSHPKILSFAAVAGPKESEGPLGECFDKIFYDPKVLMNSWEQAESEFQKEALSLAIKKAEAKGEDLDFIFAGDLLNQCISSSYGLKDFSIPYLGQYGACSTMAQSLIMGAITLESGVGRLCGCVTSSHFCSAERQYRFPLEYGGQRTPTAQWTVTGAGSCLLGYAKHPAPCITRACVGRILDAGVKDSANMGAAMAPAAAQTLCDFLSDSGQSVLDYDRIFTGDLGLVGSDILYTLCKEQGHDLRQNHSDCGLLIYDRQKQDVHAGGSGCGCAASVLCGHILPSMAAGKLKKILFIATGALMSSTSSQQGLSIPCIAHLVEISI
ncbi:MAG: stage V sporulation protein AD [Ruminococcus sp.]|nr:stage V sporulation protein AD [Ruminococcus sp.]